MEMAILSKRYIESHPNQLAFHSTVELNTTAFGREIAKYPFARKNIRVDGLKTGHVEESGVSSGCTAKRDGQSDDCGGHGLQ